MTTGRRFLALVGCITLIAACVAWIDRPVADWANVGFRSTTLFTVAGDLLHSLRWVLPATLCFLAGAGAWIVRGKPLPPWAQLPVQCAWGMMWTQLASLVLKFVIGRSQVDPPYLVNHVHEFHPFHPGQGYDALPSATMAVAAALLTVIWVERSGLRLACMVAGLLLACAIIITNNHWLGDVVAGILLGAAIGMWTARLPSRAWIEGGVTWRPLTRK